jgi:GT2 family glycosyltransferase
MNNGIRRAAIIIPVHNAKNDVAELVESMMNTEVADIEVEVLFVDDASDKETSDLLLSYCVKYDWFQYLRNREQQLFTRTINRGIRAASPDNDYYVCVNTDCVLKRGWLEALVAPHEDPNTPGVAITGYADGTPPSGEGVEECFYPKRLNSPDYVTGHCIALNALAIQDPLVGVFCESDLGQAHIGSEREWCWRAARAGYRMFYVKGDLCVHDKGGASWKNPVTGERDLAWLGGFNYAQLWKGNNHK